MMLTGSHARDFHVELTYPINPSLVLPGNSDSAETEEITLLRDGDNGLLVLVEVHEASHSDAALEAHGQADGLLDTLLDEHGITVPNPATIHTFDVKQNVAKLLGRTQEEAA